MTGRSTKTSRCLVTLLAGAALALVGAIAEAPRAASDGSDPDGKRDESADHRTGTHGPPDPDHRRRGPGPGSSKDKRNGKPPSAPAPDAPPELPAAPAPESPAAPAPAPPAAPTPAPDGRSCFLTSAGLICPGDPTCIVTSAGVTCGPDCTLTNAGLACPRGEVPPPGCGGPRVGPELVRASRRGIAKLRLTCPRAVSRWRVNLRLRRRGKTLARNVVRVNGGRTRTVSLKLKRNTRRELARARSLRVVAVATARGSASRRATTRTGIRLLAPRRRR
jgi:hypothetical protein